MKMFFCNKTVLIYDHFLHFCISYFLLVIMYLFIYTKNDHMISILIVFGVINVNSYFDIFFIGPFFAPKTIKKFGVKNGPMLVFFINLFVFGGTPKKP